LKIYLQDFPLVKIHFFLPILECPRCFGVFHLFYEHSASYPVGTRGFFPSGKAAGREADHSPSSSAEVKNAWSYISAPQYAFTAWCSVKHRDNFTFTFTFENEALRRIMLNERRNMPAGRLLHYSLYCSPYIIRLNK
jgi:hypothetical protein